MNTDQPAKPFFSIITVCFNSEKTIARTLASVDIQTFHSWEHILVDGASHDRTLQIIEQHTDSRRHWISEKDSGIYDAMNKGIGLAQGNFLCFLNSDDALSNPDCLQNLHLRLQSNPSAEAIYGDAMIIDDFRPTLRVGREVRAEDYYFGAPVVHQAYFFHRDVYSRQGSFDLAVKGGASDWAWLARYFHSHRGQSIYFPYPIVDFYRGGASSRFAWENYLARMDIALELFPRWVFLGYCLGLPKHIIKFKLLKLQFDTPFRRFIRAAKLRFCPRLRAQRHAL